MNVHLYSVLNQIFPIQQNERQRKKDRSVQTGKIFALI